MEVSMKTACERTQIPKRPIERRREALRKSLDKAIMEPPHPSVIESRCAICGREDGPATIVIGPNHEAVLICTEHES
jgi:hypothetical protein